MVFKIVERLSRNWRALNGGATLMQLVLAGCKFKDSVRDRGLWVSSSQRRRAVTVGDKGAAASRPVLSGNDGVLAMSGLTHVDGPERIVQIDKLWIHRD